MSENHRGDFFSTSAKVLCPGMAPRSFYIFLEDVLFPTGFQRLLTVLLRLCS